MQAVQSPQWPRSRLRKRHTTATVAASRTVDPQHPTLILGSMATMADASDNSFDPMAGRFTSATHLKNMNMLRSGYWRPSPTTTSMSSFMVHRSMYVSLFRVHRCDDDLT